uniref:Resistance protein candidate RGC20 n=1 Tax=Tanacetum cinerariifolium TaxID=118510 RepID=A0A6L2NKA6_TANCI|nr:resistance protein candidate RGC20 [Tanacetum cinerariifolium]
MVSKESTFSNTKINGISKVALPSYLLRTFQHLRNLSLWDYKGVEVIFEITTPSSRESPHNTQQPPILPYLEKLKLEFMTRMSHVWKCNRNEILILQKQLSQSSFDNLTTITMGWCNSIKYLFSPLMAKLLFNLKEIDIRHCDGIEEVVSNRDDEDASIYSHTTTTFFPHLDILDLKYLRNFKCIGGGAYCISANIHDKHKLSQASWYLCQYARKISIANCDALSSVIPWYAVGQMQKLQVLKIINCKSMTEVFETQEINNKSGTDTGKSFPRLEYITMLKLPKLKILKIQGCHLLKHVFTFSTLESLAELEELEIKDCKAMEVEVIVNNETKEQKTASDVVVFPRLKSLALVNLPTVVGFFLGKNEFTWPTLEKVAISECPQITMFTYGPSTTRKLNFINTSLGKHSVECGLNFHVTTTSHQTRLPSYESKSSYHPTTMERLPWSYHNLIEVDMNNNPNGGQSLFSSDEVSQLQKLETIHISECRDTKEIFDSQTSAEIPNLRQVDLKLLPSLKYIWKSKQGTVLKFPNLTRLSIEGCDRLEYVFTCSMAGSLLQLQELNISRCKRKEAFEFPSLETLQIRRFPKMTVFTKGDLSAAKLYAISIWVVSNREDEDASIYSHTTTTFFPHLDTLKLKQLRDFRRIGGGANGISTNVHDQLKLSQASWSWSLCQYAREISITECDVLPSVIPWYVVGQMQKLQVLEISDCKSMTEVFETQEINNNLRLEYITMLKLPKLKILKIEGCHLLKHVFTFSTLESLTELEELEIKDCKAMEVIVNTDIGEQNTASDVVVFPRLKSLALVNLPTVVGFFLGMNGFTWPTLKKVEISECPQITLFSYGRSTAPKLNFINTSLGKHIVECGLNFHVTTTSHKTRLPSYESTSTYRPTTMERLPWSYHNLIEVDLKNNPSGGESLFSSDKLLQLQKLESVCFGGCDVTKEIFDSQTVAEIPNLRQVDLKLLPSLNLLQLQELHISGCKSMKVIMKGEEECDANGLVNAIVVFPCLKSLKLEHLFSLEGFCLGNEAFEFPSLDALEIIWCLKMTVFTKGDLSAPKLYAINSIWGRKFNIHNRLNSFMNTSPSL